MKKFIVKSATFFTILVSILILTITIINYNINKKAFFNFKNNVSSIILGNSHSQAAFNDSIIPNCINFSCSGESYLYSYYKAKKIIENLKIKTIYIEFTNIQIHSTNNDWIWGDEPFTNRFPVFSPFFDFNTHFFLIDKNLKGYLNGLSLLLKKNISKVLFKNYNFTNELGGYKKLKGAMEIKHDKKDVESFLSKTNNKISFSNIFWLKKIDKLCDNNNIKIVFIRSPQHRNYILRKNENYLQLIKNMFFKDNIFLDFNDYINNDAYYVDYGHLNEFGSKKISNHFKKII